MTEIIIIGNDENVENEIIGYFSLKKSVIVSKNSVSVFGNKYLIINNIPFYETKSKNGIIIMLSGEEEIVLPQNFTAICESANTTALSKLMENDTTTITVGMKSTDTVTFSSINEKSVQISVQRKLHTVNDETIEPGDYNYKRKCKSELAELFCTVVMLMT